MAMINPKTLMTEHHANRLAWTLNTTEDPCEWTYQAKPYGDHYWIVVVFDEDGLEVGSL